jgi:hypothetical protein
VAAAAAAAVHMDLPLEELEEDVLHPRRLLVNEEPAERLHRRRPLAGSFRI